MIYTTFEMTDLYVEQSYFLCESSDTVYIGLVYNIL